jgi:hypothetical protein
VLLTCFFDFTGVENMLFFIDFGAVANTGRCSINVVSTFSAESESEPESSSGVRFFALRSNRSCSTLVLSQVHNYHVLSFISCCSLFLKYF